MTHDLQGIFDALLEGVLILDEADRIERVNPEARRLLGVGHDLAPGRTLGEALRPDHPVCRVVERVRRSGRASIHDEVEIPQRFENPIPVDVAVSNIGEAPRGRPLRSRSRCAPQRRAHAARGGQRARAPGIHGTSLPASPTRSATRSAGSGAPPS